MRVKTITAEFGFTKNLGNFQSAKISAQMWAEIDEDENEDQCLEYLFDRCKAAVRANIPTKEATPNVDVK
jgi:hypothetical protein